MQEETKPQPNSGSRRYSDAEANEVYKRAAEIEAETLFQDESLTGDQVEEAANSAGISDAAVDAAIDQIEREREEVKAAAAARARTRNRVMGVGRLLVLIVALSGFMNQRALSSRMADVETARANVETTLQRRQDLIPTVIRLAKENLSNERALIAALDRPHVDEATVQLARKKLEERGVESTKMDEIEGTENRIAVARRRYNEKVGEYNRNASYFPASAWRGVFGLPTRVEPFAADKSAFTAPKFD